MITKCILFGLFAIIFSSCSYSKYLSSSEGMDTNVYGSQIRLKHATLATIKGELIAIDSSVVIVLQEKANKCTQFKIRDIEGFKVRYAKSKNYGWTIPVYTLATIGHGLFLVFTAPINFITTVVVTVGAQNAFILSHKDLTFDALRMFARFPQGIPNDVDLGDIEYHEPVRLRK